MKIRNPFLALAFVLAAVSAFAGCAKEQPAPSSSATQGSETEATKVVKEGTKRRARKESPAESTRALGLRVRLELLQKLGIDSLRIDVEAEGSTLVLAGEVKKRATAELAEEVARQVEGVAAIENRIRVAQGEGGEVDRALAEAEQELADAALETRARIALVDRMGSDGFRIGTDAASGVLTLEFPKKMPRARRQEAVELAKKVEGVAKVVSLDKD